VEAFVSRGQIQRVMGRPGRAALTRSSLLGMASSSCSYAASALARSLFRRGADFTAAMVFMSASTNLVAAGGRAVAGRHQLRRSGGLRLRRPDLAAPAGDLQKALRRAAGGGRRAAGGGRRALWLLGVFWLVMSAAGLLTELLAQAAGLIRRPGWAPSRPST
jgi:hypothetical protein